MMKLDLALGKNRPVRLLCLGAHSDDIEIGCGGTILRLLSEMDRVDVHWVVFAASGRRRQEAVQGARKFLSPAASKHVIIKNFSDGFFPYAGGEIKRFFESMKDRVVPDIVFTHYRHDLHQDHRLISELTWNTFRDHLILEYEVLKYDGDLGSPNVFVPLSEAVCRRKIEYVMGTFGTQADKDWFSPDTFLSLLRIRGIECHAPHRFAEGFHGRKLVL